MSAKPSKTLLFSLIAVSLVFLTGFVSTPPPPTPPATLEPQGLGARITQVDTSQFPKVTAYVSVTDAAGEPVAVSPSQLVVRENGQVIAPESVSGVGDIGPLATLLVIDISGSMNSGDKLKAAKTAARAYVEQSRPGDQIGLLTFNTEIEYAQPLTEDRAAMLKAIDSLKARDDTAMYDALGRSIDILASIPGRKAVIVMTDGLDNRSKITSLEVIRMIGPQGLSISTVGLGDPTHSKGAITSLDEAALSALAEQAGGAYGYANNADSLRNIYEKYGHALQSEYVISYTSPAQLRDGVNRGLSVSLEGPAGLGSSPITPIAYNPGGLVPEVAQPAPWGLFLAVLGVLVALLFVPTLILAGLSLLRRDKSAGAQKSAQKGRDKGKVKLGAAPTQPRVKLK
jgi:VWFA-related protein